MCRVTQTRTLAVSVLIAASSAAGTISLLALPAHGRQPHQPKPEGTAIFRVTTEIVQFDATVVDRRGAVVSTLGRDDFVVLQDGVTVALKDVTFVDRRTPPSGSRPRDPEQVPVVGIDVEPLILLVDDMAMTPDGFMRLKDGLHSFIRDGIPPGMEIGLLRTGQRGRRTTELTGDPAEMLARIDAMQYLLRSYHGGRASESGASEPGTRELERTFVAGTLGSLDSLLVDLRRFPGRKTVVLLSEGVALMAGSEGFVDAIEARLNRLAQLAAEAGVTVHTVDVTGVTGGDIISTALLRDGLTTLAERMGGIYAGRENDIIRPLRRVAAAERGYYLLSYEPPPGTFVKGRNPPFRKLTVRVRGEGLAVRWRAGFFGRG